MIRRSIVVFLLLLSVVASPAAKSEAADRYAITVVTGIAAGSGGPFPELIHVYPAGISDDGTVLVNASETELGSCCGRAIAVPSGWVVPFAWNDGDVRRLGRERSSSLAAAVDANGLAVGFETPRDDDLTDGRAAVWSGGDITRLPSLGGDFAIVLGVNGSGAFVGASRIEPGGSAVRATLWQEDGTPFDLGTLGGDGSVANDINDSGVVAGAAVATAVRYQPVLWIDGEIVRLPLPTYWVAGEVLAVNDAGVAVGGGFREFAESPLRWENGSFQELPGFAERVTGVARDINEDGAIVGQVYVSTSDYTGYVATLWSDGGIVDLNTVIPAGSGLVLTDAVDIDEDGRILVAAIKDGLVHTLIISPEPLG